MTQSENADMSEDDLTKVEMEVALQEELKGIYSRPKSFHLGTYVWGGMKHLNPLNMLF